MLIDRLEFSIDLYTKGSVSFRTGSVSLAKEKETSSQLIAKTKDEDGNEFPVIHSTALKGAIRAYMQTQLSKDDIFDKQQFDDTFGTSDNQLFNDEVKSVGKMGRLVLGHALGCKPLNKTPTRVRNAINRKRGTADHNKLYEAEYLPEGTHLMLRGQFFYDAQDERESVKASLAKILLPLCMQFPYHGLPIGSGGKSKNSLFADMETLKCEQIEFSDKGYWLDPVDCSDQLKAGLRTNLEALPHQRNADVISFKVTADTPFIIMKSGQGNADVGVQMQAERDAAGKPILFDTSLIGVLRSRLEWLQNLQALQNNVDAPLQFEERFPAGSLLNTGEVENLTPVEALLGVSGYAGRMEVSKLTLDQSGQENTLVNVAIDRFTGGALDTALFNTETHMECSWLVEFAIPRNQSHFEIDDDPANGKSAQRECLEKLADDLLENGLMLGHGSAKGLGWFSVSNVKMNWLEKQNG